MNKRASGVLMHVSSLPGAYGIGCFGKEAEEFITQHGTMVRTPNGYLQQVPQVSIAQTNMKIMLKFCEQFGLTPSARSRIVGGDGAADPTDEMEALLGGEE